MKAIPPSNWRAGRRPDNPNGCEPEIWEGHRGKGETYRALMYNFRMEDTTDAYGWATGALNDLGHGVYLATGESLPDYVAGPMRTTFANRNLSYSEVLSAWLGTNFETARWIASEIIHDRFSLAEIREVYAVIGRYLRWVILAGRDY